MTNNKRKAEGGMATKTNKRKADGSTVPGAKRQKKTMEEKRMEGLDILSAASAVVQNPILKTQADKKLWEKAKTDKQLVKNALRFARNTRGIQQRLIVLGGALQGTTKNMRNIETLWFQTYCICCILKDLKSDFCISTKLRLKKYARLMKFHRGVWLVDNIHFPGTKLDELWRTMGTIMKKVKEANLKRFTTFYLGTNNETSYCAHVARMHAYEYCVVPVVTRLMTVSKENLYSIKDEYKDLYFDLLVLRNYKMAEGYLCGLGVVRMHKSAQYKVIAKHQDEIRRLNERLKDNMDWKCVMNDYKKGEEHSI